jgi:hypothetical protein
MLYILAKLDEDKFKAIQSLEQKLGKPLLAFSCQNVKFAQLTEDELEQIKELESKPGLVLVAVQ